MQEIFQETGDFRWLWEHIMIFVMGWYNTDQTMDLAINSNEMSLMWPPRSDAHRHVVVV